MWLFCWKCFGLHYAGGSGTGVCPAADGGHRRRYQLQLRATALDARRPKHSEGLAFLSEVLCAVLMPATRRATRAPVQPRAAADTIRTALTFASAAHGPVLTTPRSSDDAASGYRHRLI